jgi:hypothetical protein
MPSTIARPNASPGRACSGKAALAHVFRPNHPTPILSADRVVKPPRFNACYAGEPIADPFGCNWFSGI